MGKSSKNFKRLLAAALTVILILTLLPWTALAAPVIDRTATGSLSIELKYGGSYLSGGVFDLYYVAGLGSGPVLRYDLIPPFKGVDLNAVKTASELESAAAELARQISEATKAATLTTANGPVTEDKLALGIYLVVQTGAPAYYSKAAPFLVYIPMTNADGTDWIYDCTAAPKVSYNPPGYDNYISVSVVKVWDDAGFENERPASVQAGLYQNGTLKDTKTLNAGNQWTHTWSGLSPSFTWTVAEIDVPANYQCFVTQAGNSWTLTNTRGGDVPLGSALNVTKEWIGDDEATRPDSISLTLLRDGIAYETVELTAEGGWRYAWAGLEPGHTWTVTEPEVPEGYTSSVETVAGGFLVKNTYSSEIPEDDIPLSPAPQTGLLQWPIPVLFSAGALLIASGFAVRRGKKKRSDG
jgi:hypothetical protein